MSDFLLYTRQVVSLTLLTEERVSLTPSYVHVR